MIVRIQIPTVLWPSAQEIVPSAGVYVSFGARSFAISAEQAKQAIGWLELAHRLLDRPSAREVASALRRALASLRESPPPLVPERFIGVVHGRDGAGRASYLDVAVETAVIEPTSPRIVLRGGRTVEAGNGLSGEPAEGAHEGSPTSAQEIELGTRWLSEREAEALAALLQGRQAGVLTEAGPNQRPFLFVEPKGGEGEGALALRFEDELVDAEVDDGHFGVTAEESGRLAALLTEASTVAREQLPYVFVPPEPRDLLIATVDCDPPPSGLV